MDIKPYIAYKSGYKYQLQVDAVFYTGIVTNKYLLTEYLQLTTSGKLTILKGYAWDGPSGPTFDTLNFMRGSLAHDALYQLIRQGTLNIKQHRKLADKFLRKICIEDGMSAIRAWWVYNGVRLGGRSAASASNTKRLITAPR